MLRGFLQKIQRFLLVFGPGLIVLECDNDFGAVSTYTQLGAQYGTNFLWILLLLLPICYLCQEMVVRLGIATGKGHAVLIYEKFGKWWGRYSFGTLQIVNFLTVLTEFIGIKLASETLGFDPKLAVGLFAICLIALVLSGSYFVWEKLTILLCLADGVWFYLSSEIGPPTHESITNSFIPSMPIGGITLPLIFLLIATVGTTIAPWQLFFQQSCVIDKNLKASDLNHERLDTFLASIFTILVAGAMVCVGVVLFSKGITYVDPAQMAEVLKPLAGDFIKKLILIMIINASVLGAMAVTLSSSWAYSEVVNSASGLGKKITEAPQFYGMYIFGVLLAAGIVLIPQLPLQLVTISVQVLAGLLLPPALIFLHLLLNDEKFVPKEFLNKRWNNIANIIVIGLMIVLSLALIAIPFFS